MYRIKIEKSLQKTEEFSPFSSLFPWRFAFEFFAQKLSDLILDFWRCLARFTDFFTVTNPKSRLDKKRENTDTRKISKNGNENGNGKTGKTEKTRKICPIRKVNSIKKGELKCEDDTCLLASKIQLDSSSLQFQVASTGLLIGYFDYLALA